MEYNVVFFQVLMFIQIVLALIVLCQQKALKSLKEKLQNNSSSFSYQPLNNVEEQQDIENNSQFKNIHNISIDEKNGLEYFSEQFKEERNIIQKYQDDCENTIKILQKQQDQLEQNCHSQLENLGKEQKSMQNQFAELLVQFQQLRLFFEGKITEQIQIYSQTTAKLEQLDDLSQHFQTQISLVKQEQTKELINLNEKLSDFTTNIQKNINEHQDHINALQDQLNSQQQPHQNTQEIEQPKQQQTEPPQVSTPTNSNSGGAQNGFSKPGLTRQNQEIGQLKKQSTYKKGTK